MSFKTVAQMIWAFIYRDIVFEQPVDEGVDVIVFKQSFREQIAHGECTEGETRSRFDERILYF